MESVSGTPFDFFEPSTLSTAVESIIPTVEPTLQSLGLYSLWPKGIIISLHEYLHLTLGLGWIPTLVIAGLLLRVALFPLILKPQRLTMRLLKVQPQLVPIRKKISEATAARDATTAKKYNEQLKHILSVNNIRSSQGLIGFIQIPFLFAQFQGVWTIVRTKLPSLQDTGVQNFLDPLIHTGDWMKDLTVPDPYYILPMASLVMMNIQIQVSLSRTPSAKTPLNFCRQGPETT